MTEQEKNLTELLEKFYSQQDARRFEQDLHWTENLFHGSIVPAPSEHTVRNIKNAVRNELYRHRIRSRFEKALFAGAIAAGFIIFVMLGMQYFINSSSYEQTPVAETNIEQLNERDAGLNQQVQNLAEFITKVRLDDYEEQNYTDPFETEIEELELFASNTDFWKG